MGPELNFQIVVMDYYRHNRALNKSKRNRHEHATKNPILILGNTIVIYVRKLIKTHTFTMNPNEGFCVNKNGNGNPSYNNSNKNGNCKFYQGLASWPCPSKFSCRCEYKRPNIAPDSFPYARMPDLPSPKQLWANENATGWKGWQYGSGNYGEGSLCCDQKNFNFKDIHPNPCKKDEGPSMRYVPLNWRNLFACNSYQSAASPMCTSQLQLRGR